MASFIPHYIISTKVLKNFDYNYNYNDFILGNLLPDADDGTDDNHAYSHFRNKIDGKYEKFSNLKIFKDKYYPYFDNSLVIGYYCHLLSDTIWRQQRPENPPHADEISFKREFHNDFVKLNKILIEYYKLDTPAKLTIPDSILITEIDRQNIPKMINGFSSQFESKITGELNIITLDFILNYIDNAIKSCIENLRTV